ncbi:MAG TPA: reverse transcriptase domain-containing protein [Anaerolineaceae bacterium]|nr:reverse transcriptase domain-containing protein [Anaerolineaceae bacterium]HQF44826.1 reverse transcriptase domain-containing protein [Anaerolineaceae bacterium]HQJ02819.1 reverse transcriptase domain-containing protein [Anaerolineaceae bacterium]
MPARQGFTGINLLQQALQPDVLRRAWVTIAENDGIPGVDSISIQRWRRNWEERLVELAKSVRSNTYQPHKLRLRHIPKRKPGEFRTLRIPTVTDRVLQRAVADVLMPFFEARFLDCSFGYRPGRSLKQAVQRILIHRANDRTHVLDADIDAFFDSVDHELLQRFLQADLPDDSLLPLISKWLEKSRGSSAASRGIPMGSPLSPLLANVFLHRLDLSATGLGYHLVRYADDFIILVESEAEARLAYTDVQAILQDLLLAYEPQKTRLTSFTEGFTFLGVHFTSDTYSYSWEQKRIEVEGNEVDALFSDFGPEYD